MSPTAYYKDQLAVQLDQKGFIKTLIINSFDDLKIEEGDSIIRIFSPEHHESFFANFSQTLNEKISLGTRVTLINQHQVFMFMLKGELEVALFCVSMEDEVISLFDELVKINNEQIRSIRELYKKVANQKDEALFLEEIMLVNNALINTRRQLAIKNNQLEGLNQELEKVNLTDYLTQVPNRRGFFKEVYQLVKKRSYKLWMMDFNNFKVVNDQLGHKVGDELLVFFSQKMQAKIAPYDASLYRLGGDEFAILVPTSKSVDVTDIMTTMDQEIKQFHPDISMAFGVVEIDQTSVNPIHPIEESMNKADRLMYQDKQAFHQKYRSKS